MEADLIRRAQAGDQAAFRALVDGYTPIAWRTARALLADRRAAEDALQDAWLDIWRGFSRFDVARPFRPWLITVVANRCRMQARRRTLPLAPLDDALLLEEPDYNGESDAYAHQHESAALPDALAALTAEQRRVLALRYSANLELAEIADVLALTQGAVKARLHRALVALREQLGVSRSPHIPVLPTESSGVQ